MSDKKIEKALEFYREIEGIRNILIGNGFCLSHPTLRQVFEWDSIEALKPDWQKILPEKKYDNPEEILELIRKGVLRKIIESYVKKLIDKLNASDQVGIDNGNSESLYKKYVKSNTFGDRYHCEKIFLNRDYIFTLNYDPVMYFEQIINKKICMDGFVTKFYKEDECLKEYYKSNQSKKEYLNQKYIICKIKKETEKSRICYLHGSWFIQLNEKNELKKIKLSGDVKCFLDDLFESEKKPYLVLEDRWLVKEALLESVLDQNYYLKECNNLLSEITGELLIFGCSFKIDNHILRTLNKNENKLKIYITYMKDADKKNIEKKIQELGFQNHTIEYWEVSENVIWLDNNKDVIQT